MFLVIFDTSTKRDYYRDVHNLLAMPPGSILRYDYRENHLSDAAAQEAKKGESCERKALVAYVQSKSFKKGDADPIGSIPFEKGLWIGTRLAQVRYLGFRVNRYYFDLELLGYPADNTAAIEAIMNELAASQETPFTKWVSLSNRDKDFESLSNNATSENWSAIINRLGNYPSQFAGDSFWRIVNVAKGTSRLTQQPRIDDLTEQSGNQILKSGVQAVFPIFELDRLALLIESRMPESGEEPREKEARDGRSITFSSVGPLSGFNGKTFGLRRYVTEWVEADVQGTDKVDAQSGEVRLATGLAPDGYPAGADFALHFTVSKNPSRSYPAWICALSAIFLGGAALTLKDQIGPVLTFVFGVLATLLGVAAGAIWTGTVKLPLGK